jgi:hypothetical protein
VEPWPLTGLLSTSQVIMEQWWSVIDGKAKELGGKRVSMPF